MSRSGTEPYVLCVIGTDPYVLRVVGTEYSTQTATVKSLMQVGVAAPRHPPSDPVER